MFCTKNSKIDHNYEISGLACQNIFASEFQFQPVLSLMTNDAFCLGVNELPGMVFAQPISGKAWSQLEPVLVKFLQTQPYTRTVVSDGEAALSVKN